MRGCFIADSRYHRARWAIKGDSRGRSNFRRGCITSGGTRFRCPSSDGVSVQKWRMLRPSKNAVSAFRNQYRTLSRTCIDQSSSSQKFQMKWHAVVARTSVANQVFNLSNHMSVNNIVTYTRYDSTSQVVPRTSLYIGQGRHL